MNPIRYTRTAMTLHWLIAAAVLAPIAFGWYLQLVRRLTHKPPPLPETMPAWERSAARVNPVLLYACMLIMPIAGYTASNFSKFGVKLFNAVLLPPWGADDRDIYALFNGLHVGT